MYELYADVVTRRGAEQVGGTIFAIGGFDGSSVLKTVEKLTPGSTSWTPCAPMNDARRDMAVTVDGGKIYVCGGFDGEKDLATCESQAPMTGLFLGGTTLTRLRFETRITLTCFPFFGRSRLTAYVWCGEQSNDTILELTRGLRSSP